MDCSDNNDYLVNKITNELNERQREAVTSSPNGILQIIAGPGTGKTKVLISRVAYLLLNCQIPPQNIIVTTFTKKAANELVERLELILGESTVNLSKLMVGTFHSICFRILRRYGGLIGKGEYSIASEKDSMQILQEALLNLNREEIDILDKMPEEAKTLLSMKSGQDHKYHGFDPKKFKRQISKLKSNGILPESYTANSKRHNSGISLVYNKYQEKLAIDRLFDFDDCLLYTHLLISSHPVLNFVQHVLVDEFQDTNEIQLRLMYEFAKGHPTDAKWQNNVTIVGDPDQSIYAFRDAQSINFEKMKLYYEKRGLICNQITLQENYRSTSGILQFSEDIMRQQSNRILKSLRSQKNTSSYPVYKNLMSSEEEARWIAYQIQFLLALPNKLISYEDISILVRSAYQTRVIENELVKKGIPYLMIRGKAFWERKEVMAIMDYMRIVGNENDRIAYLRTLNYPKRGIGEKTISYINSFIDNWVSSKRGLVFGALQYISTSTKNDAKLSLKGKLNLKGYLDFINEAKSLLHRPDLNLETLFDLIYTKSGIKHEIGEDEDAVLNIQEVQRQLEVFEPREDEIPPFIGSSQNFDVSTESNILLEFVSSVGLYETGNEKASNSENSNDCKVSLSTIHGSKGLEWPVVFIPGLSDGILPAGFAMSTNSSEEIDEERRCFYVAATRAKTLLYISSYTENGAIGKWGGKPINEVSRFITEYEKRKKLQPTQVSFSDWEKLEGLYDNMGKILPQKSKFDLRRFCQRYENQLEMHLEGHFYDISKEDFSVLTEIINDSKRLYSGFSTAKQGIDAKKHKTSQNDSLKNCKLPKPLKVDIRTFFKPPRQEKDEAIEKVKATNKAPAYTPVRVNFPKRSFAPQNNTHVIKDTSKLQPNKAPPYIPVRKVPQSFRRGTHLSKNSLPR